MGAASADYVKGDAREGRCYRSKGLPVDRPGGRSVQICVHEFEDAVRNSVSLGGDADPFVAIAGPIAEAMRRICQWRRESTRYDEQLRF